MKLTDEQTKDVLDLKTAIEVARAAAEKIACWQDVDPMPDAAYELRELFITAEDHMESLLDETSPAE